MSVRPVYRRGTFLPFAVPMLGQAEADAVLATMRSGWITTGSKAAEFEERFAVVVGAASALALNSCTAGLHLALRTLGIGPGDEVVTTPMTFAATVNVIEHLGAKPVLADVEPDTLNLDPTAAEEAITARTRAIVAVHYAGHPAAMDRIEAIAAHRGLHVVEDAAHALPARFLGRQVGSGSNPTAFSFYATKNITTGDGGMLTGAPDFIERARVASLHGLNRDAWRRHGGSRSWYYEIETPGFKFNMTDIQASIGLCQLQRLQDFQARRQAIVAAYDDAFRGSDALEPPVCRPDAEHAWHLYMLRLELDALSIDRDRFIQELTHRNIGVSVHFIPIHLHPYYRDRYGYEPAAFPVAYGNYRRLISLPLYPAMTDEDVGDVVEAVQDVARTFRR